MNIKFGFAVFLFTVHAFWVNGQEHRASNAVSVHFGYANMLEGTKGLTSASESYTADLCSGISWDANYFHRKSGSNFGFGFLYSGFTSKGHLANSSDHLSTHYFAPQFGIYLNTSDKLDIRMNVGAGYIAYRNDSRVYGKSRLVDENTWGGNLGLNGMYFLSSKIGISIDAQYMIAWLNEIHPQYHGESVLVKFSKGDPLSLSRLNLSAGLSYFF